MNDTDKPQPLNVRIVVFQEDGQLVAQCLEWDLATQGRTLQQLYERVHQMLAGQLIVSDALGRQPFEGLPPAPGRYHTLWEQAALRLVPIVDREPAAAPPDARLPSLDLRAA